MEEAEGGESGVEEVGDIQGVGGDTEKVGEEAAAEDEGLEEVKEVEEAAVKEEPVSNAPVDQPEEN